MTLLAILCIAGPLAVAVIGLIAACVGDYLDDRATP